MVALAPARTTEDVLGLAAARDAFERLAGTLVESRFAGYDPYDALSSPFLRTIARGRPARIVAIQALRRSPVNLRPFLGVRPQAHTKGLALAVSAFARTAAIDERHGALAVKLARELAGRAIPGRTGAGFGYDFDVETRWGAYRRGQPNAVATAFAAHAFLDAAPLGAGDLVRHAEEALRYACAELLADDGTARWFGYYRGSRVAVHNASVLLASVAARLPGAPDGQLAAAADAVAFTVARQRADGSWPYGEARRLAWVDGYHTAYVLTSLHRWLEATGDAAAGEALRSGLALYLDRLIDADGAPRANLSSRYPVDTHAAATGIATLATLQRVDGRARPAARRMLAWTLAHMARPDGRFAYQLHRRSRNSIPYVRWSDAHMLLALATYLTEASTDG